MIIEPTKFSLVIFKDMKDVQYCINECEGEHIQQVAYSSYHEALTQVCFGCKKIRTSLTETEVNND